MINNLSSMSMRELRTFAEVNKIDITSAAKKAEVLSIIENNLKLKEDNNMEEENVVVQENQEVETVETVEVAETIEGAKDLIQKPVYHLDDGSECSRSAYIRQEFGKNKSRQDITAELGIKYYIVYSATANMYNEAHPENGGAGAVGKGSVLVPKVNSDLKFVNAEGETEFLNEDGNLVEITADTAVKIPRADLMRELAVAGKSRSEIKDYFSVPYATVYAATKEQFEGSEGARSRKTLVHPETGLEIKRSDYIRELYNDGAGLDRREIAKKLTTLTDDLVDYATVWAATKPKKAVEEVTEAETVVDAVEEEVVATQE